MATTTLEDIVLGGDWINVVSTRPEADSVDLILHNAGKDTVLLVFGISTEPVDATTHGYPMQPGESFPAESDFIWARSPTASRLGIVVMS